MSGGTVRGQRLLLPVLGLSLLAAAVRAWLTYDGGIWADEGLVFSIVNIPAWKEMITFIGNHESHPPLLYILVRAWRDIVGTGDAATLALPVILGALIVPSAFLVGKRLFSRRIGLIAAAFAAFCPSLVEHASQLRPYGLLPCLVLLSCYALIRLLTTPSLRASAIYGALAAACLYTHHWTALVIAGQGMAAIAVVLKTNRLNRSRLLLMVIAAWTMIGVLYLPWLGYALFQIAHTGHPKPLLNGVADTVAFIIVGLLNIPFMLFVSSTVVSVKGTIIGAIAASIVFACAPLLRRIEGDADNALPSERIALTVLSITPIVALTLALFASIRSNMMLDRCVAMLTPLVLLIFARWVDHALLTQAGAVSPRSRASLALGVAVCLMTAGIIGLVSRERSNTREVAQVLRGNFMQSDLLIIAPEFRAPSLNHYLPASVQQIDYPHMSRSGLIDFVDVLKRFSDPRRLESLNSIVASARRDHRRIWLVTGRNYLVNIKPGDLLPDDEGRSKMAPALRWVQEVKQVVTEYYGAADTTYFVKGKPPRYEEMLPFLFTPRDEQAGVERR